MQDLIDALLVDCDRLHHTLWSKQPLNLPAKSEAKIDSYPCRALTKVGNSANAEMAQRSLQYDGEGKRE
jgi:hypothetical protein